MDPNLEVLLILIVVALLVGVAVALAQSRRIQQYGILGALRRKFSGGNGRSPYGN